MKPTGWIYFLLAACLAMAETTRAQRAPNWRLYKLADGLPESTCISVTVAPQGKVVAKHLTLSMVSELDGYTVQVRPSPETITSRVYQSPAGQLWTVKADGLLEFKDGAWVLHHVPEIAAELRVGSPRIIDPVPIYPVKQGVVLFLLPDRLMRFNVDEPDHPAEVLQLASQTQLGRFAGMSP